MIEKGLNESATSWCIRTPTLTVTDKEDYLEVSYNENNNEKRPSVDMCQSSHRPHSDGELDTLHPKQTNINIVPTTVIFPESKENGENLNNEVTPKISRPKTLSTKKLGFADAEGCSSKTSSLNSSDTEGDSWVKVNHITPDIGSSATSITSSTGTETKAEDKLVNAINDLLEGDDKGQLNNSSLKFQDDEVSPAEIQRFMPAINDGISNLMSSLRGSKSSVLPTSSVVGQTGEGEMRRWSASNSQSQKIDGGEEYASVNVIDIESDECGLPLCIFTKVMRDSPFNAF